MPSPRACPRCKSVDVHRVKRKLWDHILRRPQVFRCDECRKRFGPRISA